ncbi:hypothetical protein Lesp02_70720 [Lentzea sp. NBRC 105346]|uniref:P22 phage major capsid protein family protein n=1 Tax=Lentzea sp. NBRC 105346 TaxID=3032205 RepID=UPI0024A4ADE0|nr:P22 phage major capsid protein family protein [Lentzea sp. NBRC 105346]GLZ34885.1 hypothetical protein Lesp02_70720 [Lentzea sp. NBRC 105346]
MAIDRFIPQFWATQLLVALRKALVYGGPMVVNRDYEGEISGAGDTVRITSISDPTIGTYVPNSTTIVPEELTDAQRALVVDQAKYFAFKVDDVNARQAAGNVIPQAVRRAAYKLADQVDQYIAAMYTGVPTANVVPAVTIDTSNPASWATEAARAYNDVLIPLKVTLDQANVPKEGRYCIVPPIFEGVLLRDDRFVRADAAGTTEGLRNGFTGRIAGFDVMVSNNTPVPGANQNVITAGTNIAITLAEQINKTEAYRPESSFSDAVKGLALYGAKLIRPEGLASCTVTTG